MRRKWRDSAGALDILPPERMRYREGFLQTHPPTAERIERLQGLTREAER